MSTLQVINAKHPSSASNNIVLDASGNAAFAGTVTTAGMVVPSSSFLRNRIINGDMRIDQRNAGAAVTLNGGGAYTVDRWLAADDTDGVFTAQRDTVAPTGHVNSLKITTTTADSSLSASQNAFVLQRIEGNNIYDLAWGSASAQTVTLSFWVRSSLIGTFGGSARNGDGTRSYPFTYVISAANTWEYKTVTIPGDTSGTWLTDTGIGLQICFGLGVGSSFSGTAGSWSGSNFLSATGAVSVIGTLNATWFVTGVQLEVGTAATPFERRQFGQELALCQRYCFVLDNSNNLGNGLWGSAYGTDRGRVWGSLPVTMRAYPTVTGLTGTGTFELVGSGGVATANVQFLQSAPNCISFDGTSLSTSAFLGQPLGYRGPGVVSAEL